MSTDPCRTRAEPPIRAFTRAKARAIVDRNPTATMMQLVELAYMEGRIEGIEEHLAAKPESLPVYDHSTACQRCGRKIRLASSAPAPIPLDYVCFHCSAGDEPRAA